MYCPVLVTERFGEPPYDNCVFSSGLMLANKATLGRYGTASAAVANLRRASGDDHASATPAYLSAAYKKMFGWTDPEFLGQTTAFWAAIDKGAGAAFNYIYGKVPVHFRAGDPSFTGGHCAYIQAADPEGKTDPMNAWIIDPLRTGDWKGEWIKRQDLDNAMQHNARGGPLVNLLGEGIHKVTPGPAPVPAPPSAGSYTMHFAPGAVVNLTSLRGACISGYTQRRWGNHASQAPCEAPVRYAGCSRGHATLALVTAGVFKGYRVLISGGIVVTPTA